MHSHTLEIEPRTSTKQPASRGRPGDHDSDHSRHTRIQAESRETHTRTRAEVRHEIDGLYRSRTF